MVTVRWTRALSLSSRGFRFARPSLQSSGHAMPIAGDESDSDAEEKAAFFQKLEAQHGPISYEKARAIPNPALCSSCPSPVHPVPHPVHPATTYRSDSRPTHTPVIAPGDIPLWPKLSTKRE